MSMVDISFISSPWLEIVYSLAIVGGAYMGYTIFSDETGVDARIKVSRTWGRMLIMSLVFYTATMLAITAAIFALCMLFLWIEMGEVPGRLIEFIFHQCKIIYQFGAGAFYLGGVAGIRKFRQIKRRKHGPFWYPPDYREKKRSTPAVKKKRLKRKR
jgi:hypothetical protein